MHAIPNHMLFLALICGSLLGCATYNSPNNSAYYKADVPGGIATRKDAVEIPIRKNVSLWVVTVCYPRDEREPRGHPKGYQDCHIVIWRFGPPSTALAFKSSQFVVQDSKKPELRYETKVYESKHATASPLRAGMAPGKGIIVRLKYEMPPKQFRLHIPALLIDGKPHEVPEIVFTYTGNIE